MAENDDLVFEDEPTTLQNWHQLGILVLDGSGSMSGETEGSITKAEAVNMAVRDLLSRLRSSKNSKDFSIAVITFDDTASIHTPITRIDDGAGNTIDDNADYDPQAGHGNGTQIDVGLEEAYSLAKDFLDEASEEDVPHSVAIIVMSDGRSGGDPVAVADEIKSNYTPNDITLCTTLFAQKGQSSSQAKQTLRGIASDPTTNYKTVYDEETLRDFFIASMSADTNADIE